MTEDPVERVFQRSEPQVRAIVRELILRMRTAHGATVDPKNGSIHLNRKSAFAGLHPRKNALLLNLRTDEPIDSARVRKVERVSAHRFHNEVVVRSAEELDQELLGWLSQAAELAQI